MKLWHVLLPLVRFIDSMVCTKTNFFIADVSYLFQDLAKLEAEQMDETQEYGTSSDLDTSATAPGIGNKFKVIVNYNITHGKHVYFKIHLTYCSVMLHTFTMY